MKIPEEGTLLRVFVGESDQLDGKPLYEAIVLRARELHVAGATVFRGIMGFGKHSRVHTAKWNALSTDLPVVIELVDSEETIGAFLPCLNEMVREGLITLEKVRVLKYAARDS